MNKIFLIIAALLFSTLAQAGELKIQHDIGNQARALFVTENFKALNSMGSDFLTNKSRTPSGNWKLSVYYSWLSNFADSKVPDPEYWSDIKAKTLKWKSLNEDLSFAPMFYANILISEAWMYRGDVVASGVRREDMQLFLEKIEVARLFLEENSRFKKVDPRWYDRMIVIAMAQTWDLKKFYKLLDEAISEHPQYSNIYFRAIGALQTVWIGSVDKIEEFATYATRKSQAKKVPGMYARMYWYLSGLGYGNNLFNETYVRWDEMKSGIEEILKKYPDQWNINNFAKFACLAEDYKMTKKMMDRLVGRPILRTWKSGTMYTECRKLAYAK